MGATGAKVCLLTGSTMLLQPLLGGLPWPQSWLGGTEPNVPLCGKLGAARVVIFTKLSLG